MKHTTSGSCNHTRLTLVFFNAPNGETLVRFMPFMYQRNSTRVFVKYITYRLLFLRKSKTTLWHLITACRNQIQAFSQTEWNLLWSFSQKVECHRSGRILELHTDDCCLHKRIRVDCVHNVSWVTRVTLMRYSIFNWEFKCEMTTKIWLLQWYSTCISIKTLYILVHNNEINL